MVTGITRCLVTTRTTEGIMEDITLGRIPRNGQWIEDLDDRALNVRFYKHAVTGKDHVEISAALVTRRRSSTAL